MSTPTTDWIPYPTALPYHLQAVPPPPPRPSSTFSPPSTRTPLLLHTSTQGKEHPTCFFSALFSFSPLSSSLRYPLFFSFISAIPGTSLAALSEAPPPPVVSSYHHHKQQHQQQHQHQQAAEQKEAAAAAITPNNNNTAYIIRLCPRCAAPRCGLSSQPSPAIIPNAPAPRTSDERRQWATGPGTFYLHIKHNKIPAPATTPASASLSLQYSKRSGLIFGHTADLASLPPLSSSLLPRRAPPVARPR